MPSQNNTVGFNCAYGIIDPVTGTTFASRDGNWTSAATSTLEQTCQWAGDTDGDGPTQEAGADPLVTDPAPGSGPSIPCSTPPCFGAPGGGGFEVGIIITHLNASITGFDLAVSYDPKILNAVVIDQSGIVFASGLTLAETIDNTAGSVRLAQALLGTSTGGSGTVELFRIRFDVVGAGTSPLTIGGQDTITYPPPGTNQGRPLPHTDVQGSFSTNVFYDNIVNGLTYPSSLNFNASWVYTPNPVVPGSSITFTATAACQSCTGTLSYSWAWTGAEETVPVVQATGQTVTLNTPFPKIGRVTLIVQDQATPVPHNVTTTRLFSLSGKIYGPSTVTTGSLNGWTGWWIGGFPPYTSAKWTLCPPRGTSTYEICNKPSIAVPTPTSLQNSTISGIGYNFTGLYQTSLQITDSPPLWVVTTSPPSIFSNITPITTATFQLNVTGSNPAFTITASSNVTSFDVGKGVLLSAATAYNTNYPSGAQSSSFNYTFYFGDGAAMSSIGGPSGPLNAITHSYTNPGTFIVRVTAQERSSRAVTVITETTYYTLTVASAPTTTFSLSTSSPTASQAVTFTATVTAGTGPYTYGWAFGDGSTATGSSPSHTFASQGSYNVTLTVTDSSGESTVYSKMVNVSAAPTPPPQPTSLYLYIGIGVAVAAIAAVTGILLMRRRATSKPAGSSKPKT